MGARPPRDSTEAEVEALYTLCERLGGFDERISLQWLDGYLIAVAAAPYIVPLDDWLSRMARDAFERCFADPDDAASARGVLAARMAVLADQLDPEALLDETDALRVAPLIDVWDDAARQQLVAAEELSDEEAQSLLSGQAWAKGFAQAFQDFETQWVPSQRDEDSDAEFAELMSQVLVLGEPAQSPLLAAQLARHHGTGLAPTREDLLDEACFAVQDLRLWWLDHAPMPATRHVDATPGRNDPCPCGSGKKYKKCHGAR